MNKLLTILAATVLVGCGGGGGASAPAQQATLDTRPVVVVDGDSLADPAFPATTWPTSLEQEMPTDDFALVAVASSRAAVEVIQRYPADVHPLAGRRGSYVLFAGTNDVVRGVPLLDAEAALSALWAKARADGFRVVATTVGPVQEPVRDRREQLNAFIRSSPALYDELIDVEKAVPDNSDLTDGLHFTAKGNDVIREEVRKAVSVP
jgi:lysophospholipase L1-like esterase